MSNKGGLMELLNKLPHHNHISAKIFALCLILVVSILTLINICPVYAAENVIVLIIDGLRNDEAFDDSTHQYIPHIWNDLRPQGTINTNFWNTGITISTPAHTQIVSGVRQFLDNQSSASPNIESKYPNIFEYYRKQKNIPKNKVWFIAGSGFILNSINSSLHPDYANLEASRENRDRLDPDTWASVQQKMDTYHPSLMVINIAGVDHTGHLGIYTDYTNAVKIADQVVFDLWQKVQSDPFYRDKTDLIVTADHGRNSDGYFDGIGSHKNRNHGCRHILLLAIGPDIKQNQVIDMRRDQTDIASTVGAILGVQTPYAGGEVMTELFTDPNLGSDIVTGGQRRVSLSASGSGLHAVWSQKNGEDWDIYYKKSQDGGSTWTGPVRLFENGLNNNYFYEAKVSSEDNGLVYAVAVGYSLINEGGPTYTWKIFGRRSVDGGNTWEDIKDLKDVGVFAANPSINSEGDKILITYSSVGYSTRLGKNSLRSLYSANRGVTFVDYLVSDREGIRQEPAHSSVTSDQDRFYVIWTNERANLKYKSWNVFFDSSYANPMTWGTDKAITSNKTNKNKFYMDNSISINNSGLIKLLITTRADKKDINGNIVAGKWNMLPLSSSDYGYTFVREPTFYDSTTYEAWDPKVSFIDPATADFLVLWEQHYNGNGAEIYGRKKVAGTWQSIFPISSLDGNDSAEPDLAMYNGNAYVGWQDYETGNWQIKVEKIN